MRGPEIGEKYESCNVQHFDNQVNAVVGAHMKRNKLQTTAGHSLLG
jgi:hypothetical protein